MSDERFGSIAYCSPEILLGNKHGLNTDIWSLGVVLHVCLSGVFPFLCESKSETKKNIIQGRISFNQHSWYLVSDEAKDLVLRMLTPDPNFRIKLPDLFRHPWFSYY
jgi:serine/threonine protein kinase